MARTLVAAGLLILTYAAYIAVEARNYQALEHQRFAHARGVVVPAPLPEPAPVDGSVIGEIEIPRLGLAAVIAQGDSDEVLKRAVGHLAETALPGEIGNVVLAGHRDTFFRPLKAVRAGDTIRLKTLRGDFEYVVESTIVVGPDAVEVLRAMDGRTLTLITCFPFYYVGAAPERFIVHARQTGR